MPLNCSRKISALVPLVETALFFLKSGRPDPPLLKVAFSSYKITRNIEISEDRRHLSKSSCLIIRHLLAAWFDCVRRDMKYLNILCQLSSRQG